MHIHQTERPDCFSTNDLKMRNESKTSDLYFKKYTHVHREKSSMKVSTYQALEKDGMGNNIRSLCIDSNGALACVDLLAKKRSL